MRLRDDQKKTKVMEAQPRENAGVEQGEVNDELDWFEYLGSVVFDDGDVRKEVTIRNGKAGAVFSKNLKLCDNRGVSRKNKKTIV